MICKTKLKKLTSTARKDREALRVVEPAQEEYTTRVQRHVDKEQQEKEALIRETPEKERVTTYNLLTTTKPPDWISYVESSRRGSLLRKMDRLLYLSSCSSEVICMGTFFEDNVYMLCFQGKTSLITRLAINALECSPFKNRIQANERRILNMTGISESEVQEIKNIIQRGLTQFLSLILPADQKMPIMAPYGILSIEPVPLLFSKKRLQSNHDTCRFLHRKLA